MILFDIDKLSLEEMKEFNDHDFNIEDSISEAKEILNDEMKKHALSNCEFGQNVWFIEDTIEHTKRTLDFNELMNIIKFNKAVIDKDEFLLKVKCWVTTFIANSSINQVIVTFKGFRDFLLHTNGLTVKEVEDIRLAWDTLSDRGKANMCISSLNFLDYCSDYDSDGSFLDALLTLKKECKFETEIRELPPSRDVLLFSKITEDYFSQELSEEDYLLNFPLWIWWNITNLIPMRPSEFCKINRDCLSTENGNWYITLPRIKQKQTVKKHVQIVDKISIPEMLYQKIEEYIDKTKRYGNTDTLISYRSIRRDSSIGNYEKLDPNKFTANILRILLRNFYKSVIINKYSVVFLDNENSRIEGNQLIMTKRLNPGDTRHLAFLNLMRQGYHPVEIARLGGHTTLYAQYHYHQHAEYWVDTEILQLVLKFDLNENNQKKIGLSHVSNVNIDQNFKEKYVLRPPTTTSTKIELKDGYCTHPLQPCQVEDCWECVHWRISFEELQEKADMLEQKINSSRSRLGLLITSLQNLYKVIYKDSEDLYTTYDNPDIHKNLITTAKNIDLATRQYANLTNIKERIDFHAEIER